MLNKYQELEKLVQLKEQGILTEEEFEIEKKKILSSENGDYNDKYSEMETYFDNSKDDFIDKLLSYKGRMNRGVYIIYLSISLLFFGIALFVLFLLEEYAVVTSRWLLIIIIVSWVYSCYVLAIKKLHDINTSGWMSIIVNIFIPFSTLILLFIPGTKGDNKYGPDKGEDKVWMSLFIIIGGIFIFSMLVGGGINIYEKIQKENNKGNISEESKNGEIQDNEEIQNLVDNSFLTRTNYKLLGITKEDGYKKALEIIDNGISKFPNSSDLYYEKGNILLYGFEDYNNAIINFKKTLNLNTSYYQGYNSLGSTYFSFKEYDNAKKYREAYYELTGDQLVKGLLDSLKNIETDCGKKSIKNDEGSCFCIEGYKWKDSYDDNNFDCVLK